MKKETLRKHKTLIIGAILLLLVCQIFAAEAKNPTVKTIVFKNAMITDNGLPYEVRRVSVASVSDEDTTKAKKVKRINIKMNTENEDDDEDIVSNKPYIGIYPETISPKKARELDYKFNYGILVTGVVNGSPADKQGMRKYDVLMKINDKDLIDKDTFNDVLDIYKGGDTVKLTYYRDGKEAQMDFTFGTKKESISITTSDFDSEDFGLEDITGSKKSGKKSTGFGGGTWMPVWVNLNMDDVNEFISRPNIGFSPIKENGILLNGGGGKIAIGKGLLIGGMGAGYTTSSKIYADIVDTDTTNVIRKLTYSTGFGGVTLDKRFAITRNFIASFGILIGGASQSIEISQTDGKYNWDQFDDPNQGLQSSCNNTVKMEKIYIIAQPKAELLYRLNSWLGIRAEGAYIKSYSWNDNWRAKLSGDTYQFTGSPKTTYDAYTISVGPWFGF